MKKKLSIKTLIVLIFCFSVYSYPENIKDNLPYEKDNNKISLDDAIEKGIHLDAQYRNRNTDVDMASIEKKKAKMRKLFYVDLSASYLFKSEQMNITFPDTNPAPGIIVPGKEINAGAKHNYDLKISIVQPLFTGNILSTLVKIESQKQIREGFNRDYRKIEVASLIKTSYFTYLLLKSKKQSLSLLVENLKLHLKNITDFYQEELVKKSDLLETEVKLIETEMNLEELKELIEEEKINFLKLCEISIDKIEDDYDENIGSFVDSFEYFKEKHPTLKIYDQNLNTLQLQKKIVMGNYLPQINSFAEMHYGRPGIDFFNNKWSFYFQGGLSLNLKIFDWHKLSQEKQLLTLSIDKLNSSRADFVMEVKKKLNQLYVKEQLVQKQLQMVQQLIEKTQEDSDLKDNLYKEQQLSNLDYLSALLDKERFESKKNELLLQLQLIKLNINILIGKYGDSE